jgi:hypothetical protein
MYGCPEKKKKGTISNMEQDPIVKFIMNTERRPIKLCRRKRDITKEQIDTIEELNFINENRKFYKSVLQIKRGYNHN